MVKNDRRQERKQRQWEKESAEIVARWRRAPHVKAALREKGCVLPFYDTLDSYETEFKRLVTWAKTEFRSLHAVFEASPAELEDEGDWVQIGLPADWVQVRFQCDDELASSYSVRDTTANLRGATTGFHDADGGFHTIIQVVKKLECQWQHKEYKYALKLPVLLHEIGHCKDFEEKINFDRDSRKAEILEGEVYANLFALNQCFRRAYYMSGGMFLDSLTAYKDATDYRGEVVRRVLERFEKPTYREWMDY